MAVIRTKQRNFYIILNVISHTRNKFFPTETIARLPYINLEIYTNWYMSYKTDDAPASTQQTHPLVTHKTWITTAENRVHTRHPGSTLRPWKHDISLSISCRIAHNISTITKRLIITFKHNKAGQDNTQNMDGKSVHSCKSINQTVPSQKFTNHSSMPSLTNRVSWVPTGGQSLRGWKDWGDGPGCLPNLQNPGPWCWCIKEEFKFVCVRVSEYTSEGAALVLNRKQL